MSSLTVPDVLREAKDLTEFRDSGGQVLGFFAPAPTRSAKTHSTKEVFERLLSLTQDSAMRSYLQKKIQVLAERDQCAVP